MESRARPTRLPARFWACVNGRLCDAAEASVPASDEGLLRGDGCFEYVRVYLGRPFLLFDHLERLERSCGVLHLPSPRDELTADIAAVVDAMSAGDPRGLSYDLRVVLTRSGTRLVVSEPLMTALWPAALGLVTDEPRPLLIGAKTLSYAANMLARRLAQERGFDEALLVTPAGHVLESQTSAFFWVDEDGVVCTPPLSEGILDSITRRLLVQHMRIEERVCDVEHALAAREAFIGGTGWEVRPVTRIEDREFGDIPGVATREALKVIWREIEKDTGLDLAPHFAQAGSPDFVLAAWRELHAPE
jgi:branched-chain amino acid aminotransferase